MPLAAAAVGGVDGGVDADACFVQAIALSVWRAQTMWCALG